MHFINHVQRLSSFPLCPEIIKIIKVESQESEESLVRQKKSEGINY